MFKDVFILLVAYFVEVIHVKLPNKGGEIAVAEINWKNLLLEAVHI
jgi:hypothetical protein